MSTILNTQEFLRIQVKGKALDSEFGTPVTDTAEIQLVVKQQKESFRLRLILGFLTGVAIPILWFGHPLIYWTT